MIYRVVLDDLYDLHTSDIDCMLLNPSLELEMNAAGSFNFTLPPTHPYWDSIEILKSTIDVYEDDDLIFTGRVANIDKNWNNERVIECEGALAYFNDSIHRQNKWENPLPIAVDPDNQPEDPAEHIQNFLEDILNNHNAFIGNATNRQIHMGHIYVDPYLVTREVDYDTTLDILTRMCIDTNGGYFMIRKDPETNLLYLDWLKDFTEESGQPASFGVNLLDFNTGLHAADICTGVLARGATVNDQVVTLSNVELVDKDTYPDMSVDHYTDRYQDILWHREGVEKFGQVVQVHEFPDAQTDWKSGGQVVANSLFEEARKWLEEKNTKVESIEVEVAELSWLQEGVPKYKLGQIVEILDNVHMSGESYEVRRLPMYKLSCDLSSGSKKVTLGRPPKKELTQISASNSDSNTLSSGNSSGSSSGGGSGSGEECKVNDVRVDGSSVVSNKIANISLTGKADVSTVNALAVTVAGKADTSTVNALANTVAGKQDQIEFNTSEAATETLTRLKANGTVYNIPSGGGGTDVEANPSGSATDELEKIRIGQTIYSLPEGDGSDALMMSDFHSEEETVVGRWIDGKSLYEQTYVLRENGVDKYTVGGYANREYQLGLTGTEHTMITKMFAKRADGNWDDSRNVSTENVFTFNRVDGSMYFQNSHNATDVIVVVQYTKLADAPGTGPTKGNLIYLPALYSEEEREVGVYIDGKPLYQRTYILRENGVDKYQLDYGVLAQIGLTGADKVWLHSFYADRRDGSGYIDSAIIPNEVIFGGYYQSDGSIYFQSTHNPANIQVTLRYIKTADQPGSGTWTPEGQLAHHYSTSEKVVGTWIDGSTIYEKTYSMPSIVIASGGVNITSYINNYLDINKFILGRSYMDSSGYSVATDIYIERNSSGVKAYHTLGTVSDYITLQYTKTT